MKIEKVKINNRYYYQLTANFPLFFLSLLAETRQEVIDKAFKELLSY